MKGIYKVLLLAVIVAALISPFASPHPDGLERVAEDKGFLEKGEGKPAVTSPIPDYIFPGIKNESVATAAAGITGTLLTFGIMYGVARLAGKKKAGNS